MDKFDDIVGKINSFKEFEEKHDLLKYSIDNWSVWPLFRHMIGIYHYGGIKMPRKKAISPLDAFKIVCSDSIAYLKMPKADVVFLSLNSARSEMESGKYVDVFLDELIKQEESFVKLEDIENVLFLKQSENALIPSCATVFTLRVYSLLMMTVAGRLSSAKLIAQIFNGLVAENLIPGYNNVRFFEKRIIRFILEKSLYKIILQRISPKILVHIGGHFYEAYAAARELGITVIEMQHGFIDRNVHLGYNWGEYGKRFRKSIPLPNRLMLYGEHWKNELEMDGFWSGCIDVVGSTRLDRYRLKRQKRKLGVASRHVILWTTDGIEVEESIKFVKKAISRLGSSHPISLIIKLHPHAENLKDPYLNAFGGDNRVVVYLGNEGVSTFEHLVSSDMHFSISSTCLYEAISLGVPSVVLGLPSYEKVEPAIKLGHCQLAMTPEDLASIIFKMKVLTVPDQDKEYYFKHGALGNIKSVLNKFR